MDNTVGDGDDVLPESTAGGEKVLWAHLGDGVHASFHYDEVVLMANTNRIYLGRREMDRLVGYWQKVNRPQ